MADDKNIAIHRKPHTVLRRLAVQKRTVFGDAPCLKLSVDGYINLKTLPMPKSRACVGCAATYLTKRSLYRPKKKRPLARPFCLPRQTCFVVTDLS